MTAKSNTYITVDMGNTRTKIGFFEDSRMESLTSWPKGSEEGMRELIDKAQGATVIVSSVRKDSAFAQALSQSANTYYCLDHHTPIPIQTRYRTPSTLGRDRLAAAVGAWAAYPETDLLIFDIGTCMTYDLVDQRGVHLGGNIAPGIHLRYQAMHRGTARLPMVHDQLNPEILGTDTRSALQNGGLWGLICEIEGIAKRIAKEFCNFGVVLTGGEAERIGPVLSIPHYTRPNLVLEGLYEIVKYNERI